MPELVILVLDDSSKFNDVITAWIKVGVPGLTLIDSAGFGHALNHMEEGARNDLPLLPSFASLLRVREDPSRMLFSVVPDGFPVDTLIEATENITGPLTEPDTGILFTLPVTRVRGGLQRKSTQ